MMHSDFYKNLGPFSLFDISQKVECELIAPKSSNIEEAKSILISGISTLDHATDKDISFLHNKKYVKEVFNTKAIAVVTDANLETMNRFWVLNSKNPYYTLSLIVNMFYRQKYLKNNLVEDSSCIHYTASIGKGSYVGHNVVIEEDVEIGDNSFVDSGTVIKFGVKIGNNAHIGSNVSISYALVGDDVVILSGAKIGQDGFGFATHNGVHKKIFHIGRVIIGNNVEIGANTTIDRGSISDTVIGNMCRIDNLVQIGHNVEIGDGSIIVAQSGISGSTKLGRYCALGGQSGIAGHLTLGDHAQVAAQGGVMHNIPDKQIVGGSPAVPIREWHMQTIALKQLAKKKHD